MLYNIKGFHRDSNGNWSVIAEDNRTVAQHYKDEANRLGIYDRGSLHHVSLTRDKSSVDVSAGESVTVNLEYVRRRVTEQNDLVDETATGETQSFEVEIEDPDGNVTTQTFDPTDGAASFSITPDLTGTWTFRSVAESGDYIDEKTSVKAN